MLRRGRKSKGGKCSPSINFEPSHQLSWDNLILWNEKIKDTVKFLFLDAKIVRIADGISGEFERYVKLFRHAY